MSTIDPTFDSASGGTAATKAPGAAGIPSIAGVLTTSDHKVIGRMFIGSALLGLLGVGVLGVLLGADRVDNDSSWIDPSAITQLFAAYRVGMVEAALIPLLLGVCVLAVPLQVGARSLAFPR